jgi:hypothetical protein
LLDIWSKSEEMRRGEKENSGWLGENEERERRKKGIEMTGSSYRRTNRPAAT